LFVLGTYLKFAHQNLQGLGHKSHCGTINAERLLH
jgi:hypothetical protein